MDKTESMDTTTTETTIKVASNDGEIFTLPKSWYQQSSTLGDMMTDMGSEALGDPIKLDAAGATVRKMLQYLEFVAGLPIVEPSVDPMTRDDGWSKNYLGGIEMPLVYALISLADYLAIEPLLRLLGKHIADSITHKTPEQIREILGLPDDLTPEEKEKIREENKWCELEKGT